MGGKNTILTKFSLAGTKNGIISVSHLEEPYGSGSFPVVSIGIALEKSGEEPVQPTYRQQKERRSNAKKVRENTSKKKQKRASR